MMRPCRAVLPLFLAIILSQPAFALIKVQTPVSKMYAGAVSVIVGKVTKVSPDTGVLEAAATTLKGDGVGEALKIKLENLPDVIKNAREGSPLVLLIGRRSASNALNLADTWLFPEPLPSGKSNFIVRKELDLKQSFPGTTSALTKAIEELKAGKSTMLDEISPDMFKGGVKELGSIPAGGAALYTIKPAGSKMQTIVLSTPAGPKFFTADPTRLKPAQTITDDRPKSPVADSTATVFGNFGEEPDKLYAIVIKDDSITRYPLDGQGQPADFVRLTGERVSNYHKENPKWLAGATAAALDGDGLDDLLIVSETGAVTAVMNPKPEKKP